MRGRRCEADVTWRQRFGMWVEGFFTGLAEWPLKAALSDLVLLQPLFWSLLMMTLTHILPLFTDGFVWETNRFGTFY